MREPRPGRLRRSTVTSLTKLTLGAATVVVALTGCARLDLAPRSREIGGCPPAGDGKSIVDYVDHVRDEGRTYTADTVSTPQTVPRSALGGRVGSVRCQLAKIQPAPEYLPRDGDAGFLPAGTALYAVRGYPSSFRLAALREGSYRLYEVDTAPRARTGGDLLPLAGLVRRIDVLDGTSATKVLATVSDSREIASLVDAIVTAPVDQDRKVSFGPMFLRFHLADGTVVQRAWFPKESVVGRGIAVPRSFTNALQRKLEAG